MKKIGKKRLIIAAIAIAIIAFFVYPMFFGSAKVAEPVKTVTLEKGDIRESISTSGTLEAKDVENQVGKVTGEITEILVEVGDEVKKGDVLLRVDASDIEYSIAQTELELERAKDTLASIKVKGNLSLRNQYDSAKRNYANAIESYDTNKVLFDQGGISKSVLDQSEDQVTSTYNSMKDIESSLMTSNVERDIELQTKSVELVETRLNNLKEDLVNTEMKASMNGVITKKIVKVGDTLSKQVVAFEVQDVKHLKVQANISQYSIDKIAVGQKVEVFTLTDKSTIYQGEVVKIDPIGTPANNDVIIPVTIEVMEEAKVLKPGYTVNFNIVVTEKTDVLKVPFEALVRETDGTYFVNVAKDGTSTPVEVKTGARDDINVEVTGEGLTEGDELIVTTEIIRGEVLMGPPRGN